MRTWSFVTKYRRPVFTDEMLTSCEHTMATLCVELDVELVELNGETDHALSGAMTIGDGDCAGQNVGGMPLTIASI